MSSWDNFLNQPVTRRRAMEVGGKAATGAAAALVFPEGAEASAFDFLESAMTERDIERYKEGAIEDMLHGRQGFWRHVGVRNFMLRRYFPGARTENDVRTRLRTDPFLRARMDIPSRRDCTELMGRCRIQLEELARVTPEGKYGVFVDGDRQHMYVIQNIGGNDRQFVARLPVTTSMAPWSNEFNSNGTPLGLHYVAERAKGMLGEVVAAAQNHQHLLERQPIDIGENGKREIVDGYFVKGLNSEPSVGLVGVPEVVTAEFLLMRRGSRRAGEPGRTAAERGIRFHGTNWPHLLGHRGSGGCIRGSILDAVIMWQFMSAGSMGQYGEDGGTPIMIHATA